MRGRALRWALLALQAGILILLVGAGTAAAHGARRHPRVVKKPPPGALAVAKYLALGKTIYCGGGNQPFVAFTFDDGPGPLTPQLVQMLHEQHVRATFFLVGSKAAAAPDVVLSELGVGAIGDHTWSHRNLTKLAPLDALEEMQSARDGIAGIVRHPIRLFRPPFGQHNDAVDALARQLGLLEVSWSVGADNNGPDAVYDTLVSQVQAGSIVLLHENQPGEIEALQRFLPVLAQRGLTPVTVPMLLALDPPDPANMPNNQGQCVAHWTSPTQ